jgi:DNA primase catalytic subunit
MSKQPNQPSVKSARAAYIYSEDPVSIAELAKRYKGKRGHSIQQLQKRCAAEKWVEQRQKHQAKRTEKIEEELITVAAKNAARRLEDLNNDAYNRTMTLLKMNEQKLNDAIKEVGGKKVVNLEPKELRILQTNIIELHHELRLYSNFHPDRPIEDKSDNSDDESVLNELFGELIGAFDSKPKPEVAEGD